MFGLNHFHLHTTLITIIFEVAHVGKEALGPRMFTPASKLSFYYTCLGWMPDLLQAHGAAPSPGPLLPWVPLGARKTTFNFRSSLGLEL